MIFANVFARASALALAAFTICALAADVAPKRVLLVHSFGRDSAPFGSVVSTFRTELVHRLASPVVFSEVSLEAGQHASTGGDAPVVEFLHSRFAQRSPDLVVAIGPPASRFAAEHRGDLFPDAPRILTGEERLVRGLPVGPGDAIVAPRISLRGQVEAILQVLPQTKRIAVVLGSSPSERFWVDEMRAQVAPLVGRVDFLWLNDRTLGDIERTLGALPEHSAVLFGMLTVEAAGIPYEGTTALSMLRGVTRAPIFGFFEDDLGHGIAGGLLVSQQKIGAAMADVASRLLGEDRSAQPVTIVETDAASFDWRELRHWNIDEASLPPGSIVRFRQPPAWEQYRVAIVAGASLIVLQAALIGTLLVQRARRRRAERDVRDIGGRLITAHEDERRRLAGELHDDLTQRLARLAIDASRLERGSDAEHEATAKRLRDELVRVSEDVHHLSYRLHPSMLDDLGLVAALRAECDRIARNEPLRMAVDIDPAPDRLPSAVALCVFRVAQEALRNVVRHARAKNVSVSLKPLDGGLQLGVTDDGIGFDPAAKPRSPSLGLASMTERVRHLRGELDIESAPGRGTTVVAWVPLDASPA